MKERYSDHLGIGDLGSSKGRERLGKGRVGIDDPGEDREKGCHYQHPAECGTYIEITAFLRAQVEQHDNEKKENHHRADIDQYLDDADKGGIECYKESGKSDETHDEAHGTGNGIAQQHNTETKGDHERGKEPEGGGKHESLGVLENYFSLLQFIPLEDEPRADTAEFIESFLIVNHFCAVQTDD